ncbi:MAG TPA: chemotaxis response regulator protein-glutamate methylesterase [Syntrophorhabdaceae bacterium]|nr:chemotaxis response regulator protein-glutamate methylesterase [Syntrophorhabdaceae bacterium]HPU30529.1 chemotaxis response regulator protein-glutamate methylesterase [Syntrophorhabdaceae bacterium]
MGDIIRVLVVDDSAYVRKVVKQILSRSPFIEVVGTAKDGEEALEMVEALNPDVVTLDLIMPNLDGVEFLKKQMAKKPIPVIILSIASDTSELALKALDAGAIDFVQKPTALATERIYEIAEEIVEKVRVASKVPMKQIIPYVEKKEIPHPVILETKSKRVDIVVIGISTGGPQALKFLIPQLPKDFPVPIAIVIHMPVGYTEAFANKLNEISSITVKEAKEGDVVEEGTALIAPAGRHMTFYRRADNVVVTHLDLRPFDTLHKPSVDVMFRSASEVFKNRVLGIVMTGMGSDGKEGAAWIKAQGGIILTEAEESCIVYGMPRSVVEAGLSDESYSLEKMIEGILKNI